MKLTPQQPRLAATARIGLFLLASVALLPGCASLSNMLEARSIPVAGPENPVIDFACIWQQGEGRDQRGMPSRGFCGQLLFTTRMSKKPGIVNGSVAVYVFDNIGTIDEQAKPFEVFNFTPQEWATFGCRTNLGMTYQLFIPYTRPGGREADCSIRVKYTPVGSGLPIYSHPETIALRGASAAGMAADALDRKLMSSSPLFAQSPLLRPGASDAAYKDLMQKYQSEIASSTTKPAEPRGLTASGPSPPPAKGSEIQRLQAVLDESSSRPLDHADYTESPISKSRVQTADYEENGR